MVKREYTDESEEPTTPPRTPKKVKSAPTSPFEPKTTPKSAVKAAKVKSESETSGKKMGSWSKDELQLLYSILNPKRTGIKWDDVAEQIPGRDAKACSNKWTRMQGKIMDAIRPMGD